MLEGFSSGLLKQPRDLVPYELLSSLPEPLARAVEVFHQPMHLVRVYAYSYALSHAAPAPLLYNLIGISFFSSSKRSFSSGVRVSCRSFNVINSTVMS